MNELTIRLYNDDTDYDTVNKIVFDNFNHNKEKGITSPNTLEYVCLLDNEVVGYIVITKNKNIVRNQDYYLIDYVCTDVNHQGMGVGSKMLGFVCKKAIEDNISYAKLTCSDKRGCAFHLYEKFEFEKYDTNVYRRYFK